MAKANPYNSSNNYVVIGLDTTYKALDDYAHAYTQYNSSRKTFVNGLYLASIGLAGCLLTFVFLMFASGHPALGDRSVVLYPFDKIKTDLMLLLMAFAAYISAAFLAPLASKLLHLLVTEGYWDRASRLMMFGSLYMVGILTFFSLVRRYKAESLWTNSLLHDLTETLSESTFKYRLTLSFALYLAANVFTITLGAFYLIQSDGSGFTSVPFLAGLSFWVVGNLVVFYFLYRNAVQTDKLHQAIDKLASGETSYKVDVSQFSSLEAQLAEGLNRISDGLETALAEQVKSERLKADLITNVSHDIKTPLTSIIGYADALRSRRLDEEKQFMSANYIYTEGKRLEAMSFRLLDIMVTRRGEVEFTMVSAESLFLYLYDMYVINKSMKIYFNYDDGMVRAEANLIKSVLMNLLDNAFKASEADGLIEVYGHLMKDGYCFEVKDHGVGIPKEELHKITKAFYMVDKSRSRSRNGAGLGLALCAEILELHKSRLNIRSELGKGTTMSFTLPLWKEDQL